jgi:O-antigen/teichoic acid export membrane protein
VNFTFLRTVEKQGWAVIDQGLFALSNFVLNLLLARWLSSNDYGTFTVAYSTLLLLATFHTALLTEPMLVLGPGKYRGRLSDYFGAVSLGHGLGMGVFTLVLLVVGALLWHAGKGSVAQTIWALSLTSPFILFQWLARRACYARMAPSLAGYAGMMYALLMVVHLVALYQVNWLSVPMAFAVLGSSSLVIGIWLWSQLKIAPTSFKNGTFIYKVGKDHWAYGRWAVMTGVLMWIPGQIVYFLLPIWGGLHQCAGLRALANLIMPYVLLCTALGTILIPSLVNAQGRPQLQTFIAKNFIFLVGGGVLYWIVISMASTRLIGWLYNGLYAEYASLLWILGLLPVFAGIIAVFGAVHRSLQQPDLIFWSYLGSTGVAMSLGLALTAMWGITGAVLALVISYGTTAIIMVALHLRNISVAQKAPTAETVLA